MRQVYLKYRYSYQYYINTGYRSDTEVTHPHNTDTDISIPPTAETIWVGLHESIIWNQYFVDMCGLDLFRFVCLLYTSYPLFFQEHNSAVVGCCCCCCFL